MRGIPDSLENTPHQSKPLPHSAAHTSQPRRLLRGRRPRATRTPSRVQTPHAHAACCTLHRMRVAEYSGRVLLSDVPSSPHEVPTPAGGHFHPPDRGMPASDPGVAARAEAEPMGRSAAPQLVTATRRSPQPPPRPPSERRRAGRDPPMNGTHRGRTASDPGAAARPEAEPTERSAAPQHVRTSGRGRSRTPPTLPR